MKAPLSLLDLQKWFVGIATKPLRELGEYRIPLYDGAAAASIEEKITPGPKLSAAQRMGIYNQQYWFRLFVIMQESYPFLHRLFGTEEFNYSIAEPYLQKYIPTHWSLDRIGSKLPQWIEEEYWDQDRPLVLSAARIDEAFERVVYAPVLKTPKIENFSKKKLYLQPYLSVLELESDYFSFREELLKQEPDYWTERDFPKIPKIKVSSNRDFVVYRHQGEIRSDAISLPEKNLLKAFEKGAFAEEACSQLENQIDAEKMKIGDWFKTWAERGSFTEAAYF